MAKQLRNEVGVWSWKQNYFGIELELCLIMTIFMKLKLEFLFDFLWEK